MARKRASSDSLDLLLDTICNTFGGVLFIALLVTVMLNLTSKSQVLQPASQEAEEALTAAKVDLESTAQELVDLENAAARLEGIAGKIRDPQLQGSLQNLSLSQRGIADKMNRHQSDIEHTIESQEKVNDIARRLNDLKKALAEARGKYDAASKALRSEIASREQKVSLPKQHAGKASEEAGFFVKGGRLCSLHKAGPAGQLVEDTSEVAPGTDAQGTFVEPVAGAGLPLTASSVDGVKQRLAGFDAGRHRMAVFVWPDSFEEFDAIRSALVEGGFEYRLVPIPDGIKIRVSATGAVGGGVQGGSGS